MDSSKINVRLNKEPKSTSMKKVWCFKSLVQTMKPSSEELEYRNKKSSETNILQKYSKLFKCTKCQMSFKFNSDKLEKVQVHPCLGVLMCKKCCDYYEDGEFSLDSEGEDKYCRWCGEGGTIFGCSKCICGFCVICIKKHFGLEYFKRVKRDDDWLCFFCNPKPLWDKRYICSLAVQMSQANGSDITPKSSRTRNEEKNTNSENSGMKHSGSSTEMECKSNESPLRKKDHSSRKRIYSSSSDESGTGVCENTLKKLKSSSKHLEDFSQNKNNFENLKHLVLEKLERVLKLSEYQLAFGVNWSSKMLTKLSDPKHITTQEMLKDECEKVKWFLSVLSTYLVEFCNSIDSIEKSLHREDGLKNSSNFSQQVTDSTGFSTVMQFLAFITNQVKTFMKKGLSLPEILEAEIYDDNKFIGIKKNLKPSCSMSTESINNVSLQTDKINPEEKNKGSEQSVEMEELKPDDESRDEDSLQLIVDQSDGDYLDFNASNTTLENTNNLNSDQKKDILQILEILENA